MFSRLREDIRSIRERDPAAQSWWEVVTCYPGLHAVWWHRLSHALWNLGLRWLARAVSNLARWLTLIEIHPAARIGRRVFIDHGAGVVIGQTAEVGDDCTIYQGVTLGGTSLERDAKRHPTLERGVVVGAGAKVLGPFTVGEGAHIGSNAVVIRAVPAGATAVGIPARLIGGEGDASGFRAYGVGPDMPDPVANAFTAVAAHIQELDARVVELCRVLHRIDAQVPELKLSALELPDFCAEAAAQKPRE